MGRFGNLRRGCIGQAAGTTTALFSQALYLSSKPRAMDR